MHKTHSYLLNPQHQITVDLVGLGGTGSQVLNGLARISQSLMQLGHPGLHVRAWDPDTVSPANIGRQLFSPADLGDNKARVLISRVNRFFGFAWESMPAIYTGKEKSNILITCVDTAKARVQISKHIGCDNGIGGQPYLRNFYWLDLGNLQKTGQCVLGSSFTVNTTRKVKQKMLPHVVKLFPKIRRIKEKNQGPSCSLAEALEKQDLFINSTLAQFGCNLLWKLLREGEIRYHGCYVNLETLSVNPIKIK